MTPSRFDYLRPAILAEALDALNNDRVQSRIIAGGQNLVPLLRRRALAPDRLIDIGGLAKLRGIGLQDDAARVVTIGTCATHHQIAADQTVLDQAPLLAAVAGAIGDPAVRHRGTLGGALATADPTGDLPAVVLALDGQMVVTSLHGQRIIPAEDFFVGRFRTSLAPSEMLHEVRIPAAPGWRHKHLRFRTTAQSPTIVGVAVTARVKDKHIHECRISLTNLGDTPLRPHLAEEFLKWQPVEAAVMKDAAALAARCTLPASDPSGSRAYRAHLAETLTYRALIAATLDSADLNRD